MRQGRFLAIGTPADAMSEAQLRLLYDIEVRILSQIDASTGMELRACVPASHLARSHRPATYA